MADSNPGGSTPPIPSGRHDPEGRRRQIIRAAAGLIPEFGLAKLTHRLVAERAGVSLGSTTRYFSSLDELRKAALGEISERLEQELEVLQRLLDERGCTPETLAHDLQTFLDDPEMVRITIELQTAANTDPQLRPLANQWNDGLIELLSPHIGSAGAIGIALLMDGATVHASINAEPLDQQLLSRLIATMFALHDDTLAV